MACAGRVRRARRRFFCEARFSAAALSRASSSAAARAFASALDAVPSESVDVRTGTAPKLPRHAASSKGLRGSSVRREAGDGAPVDVLRKAVKEHSADLLVIGNRGLNTFSGRLLGSVPADATRRAGVDVLVVHTT